MLEPPEAFEVPDSKELTADEARVIAIEAEYTKDLMIWAVFNSPSDQPDKFVARPFLVGSALPKPVHLTADSLIELREKLPAGLVQISRLPEDAPHIIECWL